MSIAEQLRDDLTTHSMSCGARIEVLEASSDTGELWHVARCPRCGFESVRFFIYDRDAAELQRAHGVVPLAASGMVRP